jgi:CrcB protein
MSSWLAIGAGAALGAWLRWGLTLWSQMWSTHVPLGTLIANLAGAYLVGIAMAFFQAWPSLPPEWRLLVITGFLGGLTTFSTFSAEAMLLLQKGDYLWALAHSAMHLLGSIALCFAGYASFKALTG